MGIPNSYKLGEFDERKQQGIDLWVKLGPWAPRRLSAVKYCLESNNRQPLPKDWDWAAGSLRKAYPPALLRQNKDGPPDPILTVGEVRKARRMKFLEDRAREEQNQPMAIIEDEFNVAVKNMHAKAPLEKGKGKSVPPTKPPPQSVIQEATIAKPKVKYIDEYFVRKGKNPFLLADAIPESTQEESSSASDSWRGFRRPRPKESTGTHNPTWEGTSNWSSWKNWNE